MSSKMTRHLTFIRGNICGCPPEVKSLAYTSLARPMMLEYAAAAWDPYRAKDVNRLEMVQCKAAWFVKRDYRQTTSVSSITNQLGRPSLSDRRLDSRLKFFGPWKGSLSATTVVVVVTGGVITVFESCLRLC